MLTDKINNVDEYISLFPSETRKKLEQLRIAIIKAAPNAEEIISYSMPAYKFHGILVYFSGYKNHIGFYPMPSVIEYFKDELAAYKTSKGTVQFLIDKKLPISLISKMVKYRVKQNIEKATKQ